MRIETILTIQFLNAAGQVFNLVLLSANHPYISLFASLISLTISFAVAAAVAADSYSERKSTKLTGGNKQWTTNTN